MSELVGNSPRRDEWEIKEDCRAIKRALAIFRDKGRLQDVKDMIKSEKTEEQALDALLDGKLMTALGISEDEEGDSTEK